MKTKKCCDNCGRYKWYYDYCEKWKCEVDDRGVCGLWTERVKPKDTETDTAGTDNIAHRKNVRG